MTPEQQAAEVARKLTGAPVQLVAALIKQTGKFSHFTVYELVGNDFELLAPCSDKKEAKAIGMNYNSYTSDMPPYTFKVTTYTKDIGRRIENTLNKIGRKGSFEVSLLNGYAGKNKIKFTI